MKHYSPRVVSRFPNSGPTTAAILDLVAAAIKRGRDHTEHHAVRQVRKGRAKDTSMRTTETPCVVVDLLLEIGGAIDIFESDGALVCLSRFRSDSRSRRSPPLATVNLADPGCFVRLAQRLALVGVPFELPTNALRAED